MCLHSVCACVCIHCTCHRVHSTYSRYAGCVCVSACEFSTCSCIHPAFVCVCACMCLYESAVCARYSTAIFTCQMKFLTEYKSFVEQSVVSGCHNCTQRVQYYSQIICELKIFLCMTVTSVFSMHILRNRDQRLEFLGIMQDFILKIIFFIHQPFSKRT